MACWTEDQMKQFIICLVLGGATQKIHVADVNTCIDYCISIGKHKDAEYFIKNSSIGDMSLEDLEREAIERTLKFFNNNRRSSAKSLGMSERTLYRKIDQYGLERKIKSNG